MSKHQKVIPHLTVKNAMQAIKFYEDVFDADVDNVMMSEDGKRVIHARIEINDGIVYLMDDFLEPGTEVSSVSETGTSTVTIHLELKKPKQVDRMIAQAAAAGAEITMPPADMFWGERYARVRDPFGHIWSFGAELKKKDRQKLEKDD